MNARRIVSVWGPPVDDYAARIWSGLIGSYYLERWKHYYASRTKGIDFNMAAWERNWVENSKRQITNGERLTLLIFQKNDGFVKGYFGKGFKIESAGYDRYMEYRR